MSIFAWLDHSEKQRRQMLEAIDLFREKDTRDELGIAGIRDAFADSCFLALTELMHHDNGSASFKLGLVTV
jgi:Family of unknown function (DUF6361)